MATTLRLDNKVRSGATNYREYEEQLLKDVQGIRAGKQETYTLEEVKVELGLVG